MSDKDSEIERLRIYLTGSRKELEDTVLKQAKKDEERRKKEEAEKEKEQEESDEPEPDLNFEGKEVKPLEPDFQISLRSDRDQRSKPSDDQETHSMITIQELSSERLKEVSTFRVEGKLVDFDQYE